MTISSQSVTVNDILERHQNSFGVVRLAMTFAVLISHSFFFVSGSSASEPLVAWTSHSLGEHGVQVFFTLSGLLIAQSITNRANLTAFVLARVLRIFPGLIVCLVLTALVLGPMVTTLSTTDYASHPQLYVYLFQTFFLTTGAAQLPGVFSTVPATGLVNISLWTLKYEVACYVGIGVLGVLGALHRRHIWTTSAAIGLLMIVLSIVLPNDPQSFSRADNASYFALYFCAGILAYIIRDKLVVSWVPLTALVAAAVSAHGTCFAELTCALALGYAMLWVAVIDFGWLRRVTDTHDLSFGVYIYAAPIQQTIVKMNPDFGPLEVTMTAAVFTFAVAYLSWEWIERPALNLRRRRLQPKPAQGCTSADQHRGSAETRLASVA